ncbi:hypothetical protein MTO96_023719 [Rhipicephalus appendiculatus]
MRRVLTTLVIFYVGCALPHVGCTASRDSCHPVATSIHKGDRSSCTLESFLDIDLNRFPMRIRSVRCNCPGTLCRGGGDFRCREIKELREVIVRGRDGALRIGTMNVTVSCVCALAYTGRADHGQKSAAAVVDDVMSFN